MMSSQACALEYATRNAGVLHQCIYSPFARRVWPRDDNGTGMNAGRHNRRVIVVVHLRQGIEIGKARTVIYALEAPALLACLGRFALKRPQGLLSLPADIAHTAAQRWTTHSCAAGCPG